MAAASLLGVLGGAGSPVGVGHSSRPPGVGHSSCRAFCSMPGFGHRPPAVGHPSCRDFCSMPGLGHVFSASVSIAGSLPASETCASLCRGVVIVGSLKRNRIRLELKIGWDGQCENQSEHVASSQWCTSRQPLFWISLLSSEGGRSARIAIPPG